MAEGPAPSKENSAPVSPSALCPLPSALSFSVFLACSWTWCIGMFLPVILVRNLGIAGFAIFALPNVLGVASIGWIIHDPEHSREMVAKNRSACLWFSRVAVWFQVFFLCWMFIGEEGLLACLLGLLALVSLLMLWGAGQRRKLAAAWVALAISVTAAAILLWRHDIPRVIPQDSASTLSSIDALWLAPMCAFGFFLCPYLDLTFHEARQALSPRAARAAFGLGFSSIFLALILFTLAYSGWLGAAADLPAHPWPRWLLAAHLFMQCSFTLLLHVRALGQSRQRPMFADLPLLAGIIAAAVMGYLGSKNAFGYNRFSAGEIFYLGFLGFYGLVFPAYVWLYMVPNRRPAYWVLPIAILAAAPFYWVGFMERHPIWMLPGVLLVMAARLLPG